MGRVAGGKPDRARRAGASESTQSCGSCLGRFVGGKPDRASQAGASESTQSCGSCLGRFAGGKPDRARRAGASEQRHNDERREPRRSLRSSPKDETIGRWRGKNRQMVPALRVAVIQAKGHKSLWLRGVVRRSLRRLCSLLARPRAGSPALRVTAYQQRSRCD